MNKLRLERQLDNLDTDCAILGCTYTFDGSTCQVFASGKLKSTWTVDQLYKGEVYP